MKRLYFRIVGATFGAALLLAAGASSAATFKLLDTDGDGTSKLDTTSELVGGNPNVAISPGGTAFTDVGYFSVSPGSRLTTYDFTAQSTSKFGEIGGGTAEIYKLIGMAYVALPATLLTIPPAVSYNSAGSSEFLLGPGSYEVQISSFGLKTSPAQTSAKYSVELQGGAVPEPATWAVMLIGFGAIGSAMRNARRNRAAAAT